MNVVEDALKWRVEAFERNQKDVIAELQGKVAAQKKAIDMLVGKARTDVSEIKAQIVEAASEVVV